jgi:hypothetical protein
LTARKPISRAQAERMRAQIEAKRRELQDGLPHLYGHKWYWWQRKFFNCRNRMTLMTCANQVGKSTVHMWKKIHWATEPKIWPELWPKEKPNLFWFFYTDQDTLDREFALKWKRWLPQGQYKDHPQYGWQVVADRKEKNVEAIQFNSGILLEFKLYTQSVKNIQSATVFDIGADEEMPESFWDEVQQRYSGVDGYFSAAFTATLNQQMWWRAMEGKGESELFKDAEKFQVSKYDCLVFDDGSPGMYTEEQIEKQKALCTTQSQIDRRIYGKFAPESGRKYHAFDPERHYVAPIKIPENWNRYSGVDIGSGGDNHPAAFYFIAVRPDNRLGYIYKGKRLDDEVTTAGDVYNAYLVERGPDVMAAEKYDYHAKDFATIAERTGDSSFEMADKSHDRGEDVVNTLFENDMLFLFDTPEVRKYGEEMLTLMKNTDKRSAKDDACDAVRYGVIEIPWDWTLTQGKKTEAEIAKAKEWKAPLTQEEYLAEEIRQRRGDYFDDTQEGEPGWSEISEEIAYYNDIAGSGD